MVEVVVVGAGGFGREVLDVIEALARASGSVAVRGVVDDKPRKVDLDRLAVRGVPFFGPADREAVERLGGCSVAVGVGSPAVRASLFERFAGMQHATLVHPAAVLGSYVAVQEGTVICAGVSVGTNVSLGRGTHLNPNATVGHDSILEEFVSLNPMANVSGECRVGSQSLVGASSVVLQGLVVGHGVTIGAGAVVVRDVPDHATVKGVPAR